MKESIHILSTISIPKQTAFSSERSGSALPAFLTPLIRNDSLIAALSGDRDARISCLDHDRRLNDRALIHSPTTEGTDDDG